MARLTSTMWFAVFMKQESIRGAFVTAIKTGAQEAGAIFVIHNHLDNYATLYGPAPQIDLEFSATGRTFETIINHGSMEEVEAYLEKQRSFDPDLWIIETESGAGEPNLALLQ